MKLTYRGVPYDHVPATLEMKEEAILGKYRGVVTQRRVVAQAVQRPEMESMLLHYRGSLYPTTQVVLPKLAQKSSVYQAPAPVCPVRLPRLSNLMNQDIRQVHLENMRHSLEQRLQSAQAKGDRQLVNLLRQESDSLRLSH